MHAVHTPKRQRQDDPQFKLNGSQAGGQMSIMGVLSLWDPLLTSHRNHGGVCVGAGDNTACLVVAGVLQPSELFFYRSAIIY